MDEGKKLQLESSSLWPKTVATAVGSQTVGPFPVVTQFLLGKKTNLTGQLCAKDQISSILRRCTAAQSPS